MKKIISFVVFLILLTFSFFYFKHLDNGDFKIIKITHLNTLGMYQVVFCYNIINKNSNSLVEEICFNVGEHRHKLDQISSQILHSNTYNDISKYEKYLQNLPELRLFYYTKCPDTIDFLSIHYRSLKNKKIIESHLNKTYNKNEIKIVSNLKKITDFYIQSAIRKSEKSDILFVSKNLKYSFYEPFYDYYLETQKVYSYILNAKKESIFFMHQGLLENNLTQKKVRVTEYDWNYISSPIIELEKNISKDSFVFRLKVLNKSSIPFDWKGNYPYKTFCKEIVYFDVDSIDLILNQENLTQKKLEKIKFTLNPFY